MCAHLQRALLFAGVAMALSTTSALAGANADELGAARCEAVSINAHRICTLPLNKSLIMDLPADARDVLVSNPGIADVVVRTSRRIYLTGVAVGQTNLFVFDGNGNTTVSLDLQVERDISGLEETLGRLIPDSNIVVEMINDNIILWGSVQNAADAQRAAEVAGIFANAGAAGAAAPAAAGGGANGVTIQVAGGQADPATSSIVNLLTIEGEDQVQLTVTIAEIERNTVKQLGIDWNLENFQVGGNMVFSAMTGAVFPANLLPPGRNLTGEFVNNITIPDPGGAAGDIDQCTKCHRRDNSGARTDRPRSDAGRADAHGDLRRVRIVPRRRRIPGPGRRECQRRDR